MRWTVKPRLEQNMSDDIDSGPTPAPVVSDITPNGGPGSGGTPVDVTGCGFAGATAVAFGASVATNINVVSDTELSVVSPAGVGTVDVTVTGPAGTSGANPADRFTYLGVTGVNPAGGAPGSPVTVTGSGFTAAQAIHFGNTAADMSKVQVGPDGTTLTLTAVPQGTGQVHVSITTPLGTSPTGPADQFTYKTGKEGKDGKDGKEHKDHKDFKDKDKEDKEEGKEHKEVKEKEKEGKEGKEKDAKEKETKDEGKEGKEHKDHKDVKDKDDKGEGKELETLPPSESYPPARVDPTTNAPVAAAVGRPFIGAQERPAVGRKALRDSDPS
jgi:IPT/TIG domain